MPPKVSIVTTVYNGEKYFDRVIPSILNQSFADFEWLIVDDASTDSTPEYLASIATKDSRVKVLSPGKLGVIRAANFAIDQAQGEYIARQDFDDLSYPDRLQLQVEYLDAHPEVGVVGCSYVVEDEYRQEHYVRIPPTEHPQLLRRMAKCVPFANTLVMFRKQAWSQAAGYPVVDDGIEDLRLWIEFARRGWKLGAVAKPLGKHWVHSKSFWHQSVQYAYRQRALAKVQWQSVWTLNLPLWMAVYPLGRFVYCYLPKGFKSFLRRNLAGSHEQDISSSTAQ